MVECSGCQTDSCIGIIGGVVGTNCDKKGGSRYCRKGIQDIGNGNRHVRNKLICVYCSIYTYFPIGNINAASEGRHIWSNYHEVTDLTARQNILDRELNCYIWTCWNWYDVPTSVAELLRKLTLYIYCVLSICVYCRRVKRDWRGFELESSTCHYHRKNKQKNHLLFFLNYYLPWSVL